VVALEDEVAGLIDLLELDAAEGDGRDQQGRDVLVRRVESFDQPQDRAVPLLEAAFRLFGWKDEAEAAVALNSTPDQVGRWRSGAETIAFADFLTLTSMIGVAAAEAMKGGDARIADISAAAEALGVAPGSAIGGALERTPTR
jgi:hypothetical protein